MTNWGQILFNSVQTGSLYLLSAVALTLTYGLSRFPNFAHAEFMTLGAYIGFFISNLLHLPLPLTVLLCILCAFLVSGGFGLISYKAIFGPLLRRGSSLIHLMIASMAIGFIIRYTITQLWPTGALSINLPWPAGFDVGPVRVNAVWLLPIAAALVAGVSMHLVLTRTNIGRAIRATSSNPQLAMASGINTGRVLLTTWFLSAGLAGIAGFFLGANGTLSPVMGWNILLSVFAVTILGGIGSFYGAMVAAFIIGLAENVGIVLLAQFGLSTNYNTAISFAILIIVLLVKPEGLTRLFKGN
jgi:branched-subunit amino acid ABC-type transport system permease component